ncbi:MAG: haloacid dehalogenase-like hydrolase [Candidatus Omnitrophica bacterium]|nr:haloacid dehalogenase-like hydrolase [Candidatus Omnitrophota bacterium]
MQEQGGILVSDFDGTMTRFDFYDLACREFPNITGNHWNDYESGRVTHFEGLRRIFAGIRGDESRLLKIIDEMQLPAGLASDLAAFKAGGWDVVVASAGCDWYIKKLLANAGVSITVHANPGEYFPDQGIIISAPEGSPFFSPDLGVNKMAVVRDALSRYKKVAFAGDGRPDLAPALLVPPERRFAKAWLAKKLTELNEPFQAFEVWSEIPAALLKGGRA